MSKRFLLIIVAIICLLCNEGLAGTKIADIKYKGNIRIPNETIFAYLELNKGDALNQDALDRATKSLFKTGFFSDIKIYMEGASLVVEVEENPMVNKVLFEGNKKIDDEDLLSEVNLKPRTIFSYAKVQEDVNRFISLYQKRGWYSAKVEPKMIKVDQNRVNVVYEIDEGKEALIQKIIFDGNKTYSNTDLAGVIVSKEDRWYRFFSSVSVYDPDKFKFDAELLKRFYLNHGFADFNVINKSAELSPTKEVFILTFIIDEGDIYTFENISVHSLLKDLSTAELEKGVAIKKGSQFNQDEIDKAVEDLTDYLGEHGYPFVDVEPILTKNKELRTVDVKFHIKEEYKAYVNKINIKNNTRTLDKVIRREFRIAEGDPYNVSRIQRSKQRIENLGFFNKVEFKNKRTEAPDKMDIEVEVEETSTGSLNFQGGYNTSTGMLGGITLSENNFLGKGQEMSLSFLLSKVDKDTTLSFTEPHFLDKELAVGFDLNVSSSSFKKESSYASMNRGFAFKGAYNLTEHLTHAMEYSFRRKKIYDVAADASRYVKEQAGKNSVSAIDHKFIYDHRDSAIDPKEGYKFNFEQELAGLGGNTKYIGNAISGAYYIPFFKKKSTLLFKGMIANRTGYGGKKVRLADRYENLGPEQIRGFDEGGIGPRDMGSTEKDSLNGETYYTTTVEFQFPISMLEDYGVKAGVFNDAGSIFGLDIKGPSIVNSHAIRASYGASAYWRSPVGPIGVHYGIPYKKKHYDVEKRFSLTFKTDF